MKQNSNASAKRKRIAPPSAKRHAQSAPRWHRASTWTSNAQWLPRLWTTSAVAQLSDSTA